ncbi:MAG: TonB-dependent receptor [Acidobacteriia bacterium]|nr:TonB-dependent receptor [Terriglobia bacterium]
MKSVFRLVAFMMLAVLTVAGLMNPTVSRAQLTRGSVAGTVHDASGAIIPGATIKVTNLDTGSARDTVTNGDGFYRVAALEPGNYSVVVSKDGFQSVENRAIVIQSSKEITFDVDLKVAAAGNVTVDVTGQAEGVELNKTNPTIGLTSTSRQAVELPLSAGRDINQLSLLSPNVFTAPGSTGISANGQRARNDNFMIDGTDNNDISVTLQTIPVVPEVVGEYQVQTNAYSAEFGRNSGATLNVITRSGTNSLHGDGWEYYRDNNMNALSPAEKRNGLTDPARFDRHQVGFDVGGPIKKDKTFWFFALQWDRTRNSNSPGATATIPTPAGFALLGSVPLRAASGTTPAQSTASRQAVLGSIGFLNNIYAGSPVFSNPSTTKVNGVVIPIGNINFPISQPDNTREITIKVDHKLTNNDNLTGRYIANKDITVNLISNCQFGALFCGNQDVYDQNGALSETHIFGPTLLNEFRFSAIRRNLAFPENDPKTPSTTISGFFGIGGASNFPQGRIQNSFQFQDTLSWQKGRQSFKFGTDIRRIRLFNLAAFDSKGTYSFNNFQDFMNNAPFFFQQSLQTSSFDARQTQQAYFVQDDFKATPNLTLNLGLRYEYSSVPFGFFGATDAQSLGALVPGPVKPDKNNWAPRVGFAYSPHEAPGFLNNLFGDGKTVFRGGFGIAYDILFYNLLVVDDSNFPRVVTPQVFGAFDIFPSIIPVSGAAVFNPLATYVNTPSDARDPYAELYSLSVQREFARDFVLEFGYTGSRGINLPNQGQANPAILTAAQIATVQSTLNANSIPSVQARRLFPQFGSRILIPTFGMSSYNAGYVSLNKRLSRGLLFGASYTWSHNISNNDESLGVGAITAGSPQIPQDYLNMGAEKSTSAFDRTQRFVVNYIYEIPWFKSGWAENWAMRQAFSGWQLSGISSFQSGQPFSILTGVDTNGNGTAGSDRPNFNPNGTLNLDPVTGNLRSFSTSLTSGPFITVLGTNGLPLANSLGNGNLGKNTFRGPGFANWNISLSKVFKMYERYAFTIRLDMLNAFNERSWGNPVNVMNSANFGKNLNSSTPRTLTLGAKFSF